MVALSAVHMARSCGLVGRGALGERLMAAIAACWLILALAAVFAEPAPPPGEDEL